MNELIKVSVNQNQEQIVSARELHEFLEVGTEFRHWFPRMCEYGFEIEKDYTAVILDHPQNKQQYADYHMLIDMAKEICMITRNDKGKQARQYFIEIEKAWNNPEMLMARSLQFANTKLLEYKHQLELAKPKIDFHDAVVGSSDTIDMGQVAKVLNLGIGRNTLFEILREKGILRSNNEPFQAYCDKGWFRLVESKFQKPNGDICINIKTVVFQKGVDGIRKIVREINK